MGAYEMLAGCYDRLTSDVDYRAVAGFYRTLLDREGVHPRSAVDLACGTGSISAILAEQGLAVTGVDMSEEMLTQAAAKTAELPNPPVFVRQKLQRLSLPRGVDLAVCALDSLDYITAPRDCAEAIRRVYRALNPGGMFIFDVNTPEKLRAMVEASGAHSTDMQSPETADHLCAKCDAYAACWKPAADALWAENRAAKAARKG